MTIELEQKWRAEFEALRECISALEEKLNWQNAGLKRTDTCGGYDFYVNEEWTGVRDVAIDENAGFSATLMKQRFDPDDERVRIRLLIDDDQLIADKEELRRKYEKLKLDYQRYEMEIQQTLGKALGYPWFKDDLTNFPDATEKDGVCVGDHVAASLAMEVAEKIEALRAENARLREALVCISKFNPKEREICCDEFAYDRLVAAFNKAAQDALGEQS